ncbi:uncharacterized protein BDW43DRAFT_308281 [Aspergillus alliaceus]|uniref:uncharacterized protein n=1 Tax=Petromyces alliaceus TaxID=209559 RepID=UPI0012A6478D|nr:uncharacterized protein BDW43DRAFT_308281 [Aspergillus alliaceus]KAB8236603.1 hypothetical protein BDW43DRAFT_308281 [Aspergillus alliaceus]
MRHNGVRRDYSSRRKTEADVTVPRYDGFKLPVTGRLVSFTLAAPDTDGVLGWDVHICDFTEDGLGAGWNGHRGILEWNLCSTVFQPSTATLSNIFGRRPLICISIVFFIRALVTAIASNVTQILIGRCGQGVGDGGLAMLSEVIRHVQPRIRPGANSRRGLLWCWTFYGNIPFIGINTIFVLFFFRLATPKGSQKRKLRRIDYAGTILFVGSISSFLIPLSWGGIGGGENR